ncbi:hypothetical protein GF314_15190 [bacterium]|nr:hypothetical protein [bacterium]
MTRPHDLHDDSAWPADRESSRREQMRRFRALPLAEKIKAVEEMERLARTLAEAVERRRR